VKRIIFPSLQAIGPIFDPELSSLLINCPAAFTRLKRFCDRNEIRRDQGSTTDQAAIHIWTRENFLRILSITRSTI
jgi:hypothetical protein